MPIMRRGDDEFGREKMDKREVFAVAMWSSSSRTRILEKIRSATRPFNKRGRKSLPPSFHLPKYFQNRFPAISFPPSCLLLPITELLHNPIPKLVNAIQRHTIDRQDPRQSLEITQDGVDEG